MLIPKGRAYTLRYANARQWMIGRLPVEQVYIRRKKMEKNISRRGFLRIGGVAGITAATGGLLASCGTGGDSKKNGSLDASNREWAGEADVIVVGGGGTGFCAAVEAFEAGSSVLVIDKNTVMGGNTALSGGMIQAAGHRLQKNLQTAPMTRRNALQSKCLVGGAAWSKRISLRTCAKKALLMLTG